MRVRRQGSREIPCTCIAGDTRVFGEGGIGLKRQAGTLDGMLSTGRRTRNFLPSWSDKEAAFRRTKSLFERALRSVTQVTPAFIPVRAS
jgi:hypothetical protein